MKVTVCLADAYLVDISPPNRALNQECCLLFHGTHRGRDASAYRNAARLFLGPGVSTQQPDDRIHGYMCVRYSSLSGIC
jgi:hypothetical protein